MVKIQIISDIHLEFRGDNYTNLIIPSAPILCLLGDICVCGKDTDFNVFKSFISHISTKFQHIFFITGNHEYYTTGTSNITSEYTIDGINKKIKQGLKPFKNVYFLNNETKKLSIDGINYIFIGTTLWTNVDDINKKQIENSMNDYGYIYVNDVGSPFIDSVRKFRVNDMVALHNIAVKFIKESIKKIKNNAIGILLVHHKPLKEPGITNQAYESDLADEIIKPPIKLVGYGHTHVKYDKMVNNVRVVSNPKGYISQKTRYDPTYIVEI